MPITVKLLDVPMNDEDVKQFMTAFEDFIKHAHQEVHHHTKREAARQYTKSYFETRAAELNVPVDYYISEFV